MGGLFSSPEAELALERVGADPAEFFEELVRIADDPRMVQLAGWLSDHHLSMCQVWELVADVRMNEPTAEVGTRHEGQGVVSAEAKRAVVLLWARGVGTDVIARLLELEQDRVEHFLRSRGASGKEEEILRLHYLGENPADIAKSVDMTRYGVSLAIRRAGLEPHAKAPRVDPLTRGRVIQLRNGGKTYSAIAAQLDMPEKSVRAIVKTAGRQGLIKGYGQTTAVPVAA